MCKTGIGYTEYSLHFDNPTHARFIELCKSFGCEIKNPQVVLLLNNFNKTVGCSSFKISDKDSCEITTLFLNSFENREKIAYKLIRQLEKIAMDLEFKNITVTFESREDILIDIFKKLDYNFTENTGDVVMIKKFKTMV